MGVIIVQKTLKKGDKPISKITQCALQKEAVSSLYLAELLNLSVDKKMFREDFDLEEGRNKLLSSPLIEDAKISFISEDHILVKYWHVNAMALIGDFNNVGIDREGRLFPIKPFLSPKGLVKIFLGIQEVVEGGNISFFKEKNRWVFAKKVLEDLYALEMKGRITSIDVSKIEELSLGKNELIVTVDFIERKDILRLSKRNYLNEVSQYCILCDSLKNEKGTKMIDFRSDGVAFIERF